MFFRDFSPEYLIHFLIFARFTPLFACIGKQEKTINSEKKYSGKKNTGITKNKLSIQ